MCVFSAGRNLSASSNFDYSLTINWESPYFLYPQYSSVANTVGQDVTSSGPRLVY